MKIKIFVFCLLLLFIGIFYILVRPYYIFTTKTLKISVVKALFSNDSLKTFDNQVNILILGIAGGENQGPNLSDSIIVANYNLLNNQLTTVSIPRDVWSATLRDKINSAYAYGFARSSQPEDGIKLAKAEVSSIIGQPIHYAGVIDFSKFEQLIDFLGGVEIYVDRAFTDKKFPIEGRGDDTCGGNDPEFKCRYETLHFEKGLIKMDGKLALKFVRSRNAVGPEGSDFAREKRQQKVISALEKKLLDMAKKPNLNKWDQLYQQINQLVKRDITNQQAAIIGKTILFNNIFRGKKFDQKSVTLAEELFTVPPYYEYDGKYVLIPADGNFTLIHKYINCNLQALQNCEDLLKQEGKEN